jgi:APA family basic amino acid/polyamine antiporter
MDLQEDAFEPRAGKLPRVLGPIEALCLIVGSVIGSGIFIVPARVAKEIPAISGIAFAWVVGGLFSLFGALTLAELGAMLPHAGGPYVYLRKAFGPVMAFLFGWTEFLVIRSGSVATLAAAFALYFSQLVPAPNGMHPQIWLMIVACAAMALVATINSLGTKLGGGVHVVGTALKVGALAAMMILPFMLGKASPSRLAPLVPEHFDGRFLQGMMAAMVGILWSYDGWVNVSSMAEEIKEPGRNIPRALMLGMAILIAVYVGMTLVYHLVLPMSEVAAAATAKGGSPKVVAAVFCQRLRGGPGLLAISLVVMCSTLIALNGNAMSGPRAYFAMARDGLFPKGLCTIDPRFQTPRNAIVAQAVWAIALTVLGTLAIVATPPSGSSGIPGPFLSAWKTLHAQPLYDVLYGYVIFGGTVIYTLTIASVFVLRHRFPELERPYRTWGYPFTPVLYIAASCYLMSSMLTNNRSESFAGLGIILLGLPAYLIFARSQQKPPASTALD